MNSENDISDSEDEALAKTVKLTLGTPPKVNDPEPPPAQEDIEEKVRVAVRVRPLNSTELTNGSREVAFADQSESSITLRRPSATTAEPKTFTFDAIFPPNTQQADLYNQVARPIVQNVIQGYNGTIFAYGQTGTGKTYTMEGDRSVPELKGIIPNSFAQIFSHISHESGTSKFLVRVTYLEIYNEEIRDLLIGKEAPKKLEINESETGVYVRNLCSFVVKSEKDMDRILAVGKKSRATASTNMNAESSRSHAIFTVTVECSTEDGTRQSLRMGKLNLVDLAGSERASKSGATGLRLKEGAKINLSLSCLGNVISALVDAKAHIPYRDSKLTRLLQDSLGGNAKTVMIANVGPAEDNYEETLSTLRYADRAKRITNHAHINEDPKDAILRKLKLEMEALKKQLEEEDLKLQKAIQDADEELEEAQDSETLSGIKGELEMQKRLSTAVQAEAAHKQSTLCRLKSDVVSWKQQQAKKEALTHKLASIQSKIMVGGESLLDKSQEQEAYLQRCMLELDQRRAEQTKLQTSLTSKLEEKMASEEKVLQLQAAHDRLKTESQKWSKILKREKLANEMALEEEDAEKSLLETEIRKLNYEIARDRALIDAYVPKEALNLIQNNMTPNDDQSWRLRFADFAGNNLNLVQSYNQGPRNYTKKKDLSFCYKTLPDDEVQKPYTGPEVDRFGRTVDYTTVTPVRTRDLLTSDESARLLRELDLIDPPTFHFKESGDCAERSLFSRRSRH